MDYLQLIVNPGSTSTKVAIFLNDTLLQEETLRHDVSELSKFKLMYDQLDFRRNVILEFLKTHKYSLDQIDVFVGRGGMLRPLKNGGTYPVNEQMLDDLKHARYGEHASNLGALICASFANPQNKPAFVVNPVCIDEFDEIARVSGQKLIKRRSLFHALNQKAIAMKHALYLKKHYNEVNLIVVHLGGGISVGLHKSGRVVDCNNALGGDGPFSPERTGTIPTYPLVDLCFSGKYTKDEIKKLLVGEGGLVSYLGTNDARVVEQRINAGDKEAQFYYEAMGYNIVKEIGAMYFAAKGKIDGILITGGMAYSDYLIDYIRSHIENIAPVTIYPGEDEIRSLAEGSLRVLNKEEKGQPY